MPRRKKNLNIFNARVRHTKLAGWRYLYLIFLIFLSHALLFSVLTYWAGFGDSTELFLESRGFQVKTSHVLVHEIDSGTQIGLTNAGLFGILHEITVANTDDVDGEFTVKSTISKDEDVDILTKRAIIGPTKLHTFSFLHDKSWPEGTFNTSYTVEVPNKIVTELGSETLQKVIIEETWDWPWPNIPFDIDDLNLTINNSANETPIQGAQVLKKTSK